MKKLIGSLLLAASFVAAGSSAYAADIEQTRNINWTGSTATFNSRFDETQTGLSFIENYQFNLTGDSVLATAVISTAIGDLLKVDVSSFTLTSATGATYSGISSYDALTDTLTYNLRANNLLSGLYTLTVAGTVLGSQGGSFAGNINVAAVPEASTTAMMVGGLALVGFVATRRRRKAGGAARLQGNMMAA